MAVVFSKIRVITKPGCVGLFSQKTGTVPALCLASQLWVPEWAVGLERLAGWYLRAATWECSVWCTPGLMCLQSGLCWVMACGSPVWLTESTWACWAEQDGFFWICKQGLKQNFRSPFPVDLSAYEFRQRGHKTLMCLFELCVEELSVRMVQYHCSHRMMTVLLILWICCLVIFVHELRAMQRNYTHIAIPSGRTISKMKPLKAC